MEDKKSTIEWGNKVYNLKDPKGMKEFVNLVYKDILFFPKAFLSTNKIIFWFVFVTLFTIGLGIFLSINSNNWLWFSRFGSICTAIAILFTFYDISSYYDKKMDAIERSYIFTNTILENWFDKILANKNLPDKEKGQIEEIRDRLLKDTEEGRKSIDYLSVKHEEHLQKDKMRTYEVCIFIVSALIWGFGDLIGDLLKK